MQLFARKRVAATILASVCGVGTALVPATTSGGDPEVLNPGRAWDEAQDPWIDLCEIKIEDPILDNDVLSALDLTPNRSPRCIKIPFATSPDEWSRARNCLSRARAIRAAAEKPASN